MSLILDKINKNSQAVSDGKFAILDAINAKGGTVEIFASTPSFESLVNGINSIVSVNGGTEATILAESELSKGDICALKEVQGSYEGKSVAEVPLMHSSLSIDHTQPIVAMDNGNLILACAMDGTNKRVRFFYLDNGEYKEVTGTPTTLSYVLSGSIILYNSEAKLLYVWHSKNMYIYRLENLTFTEVSKTSVTNPPFYCVSHFNVKNSFIGGKYIVYVNPDGASWNYTTQDVYSLLGISVLDVVNKGWYYYIKDMKLIGDTVWFSCHTSPATSADSYILKMAVTTEGKLSKISHLNVKQFVGKGVADVINPMQLSANSDYIFYLDNTNTLHRLLFNGASMTLTEVDLVFSDGLEASNIDDYVYTNENHLYIKTSNKVRLYFYDSASDTYTFIGYPNTFFSPNTQDNELPQAKYYGYLTGADGLFISNNSGIKTRYDVGKQTSEYDYYANNCYNRISTDANVCAYGIALENISSGDIGKAQQILSGQQEAFNDVAEASIGGAY